MKILKTSNKIQNLTHTITEQVTF